MKPSLASYIDIATYPYRILNHMDIIRDKMDLLANPTVPKSKKTFVAGHIELQLTDKCCLDCSLCHFRNLGDHEFEFDLLNQVIWNIRPRAITLAGGGEPTLYPRFSEAIHSLATIPHVKIGLITNGVVIPPGSWSEYISWVRVSVYSIVNDHYSGRPKKTREQVFANINWYIENTSIPNVGIHFLFYKENVLECISIAKQVFETYVSRKHLTKRIHLQFKPAFIMSRPSTITEELDKKNVSITPSLTEVQEVVEVFQEEARKNPSFGRFLKYQSNSALFKDLADSKLKGFLDLTKETAQSAKPLERCYVCLAYALITPSGFVYPCLTLAEHRLLDFAICHISEIEQKNRNSLCKFYNATMECCNQIFCRNWQQNEIVNEALSGVEMPFVPDDVFF